MVVRAFDPCISCSAHMVQVTKAPADDWKARLRSLTVEGPAVFIGLGREDRSDDRAGLELARRLRDRGLQTVWLEQELAEAPALEKTPGRFILLDAVDFGDKPGKVCLLPLRYVLWNASLSHRLASVLSAPLSYQKLMDSYLLGIQPASILEGGRLSVEVEEAVDKILKALQS